MIGALVAVLLVSLCACGGGSARSSELGSPPREAPPAAATPDAGSYVCFRAEVPATESVAAGPRGLCSRSVDDCRLARGALLDALAAELGTTGSVTASECAARRSAFCTVMTADDGSANMCTPDAETCSSVRANLERGGRRTTSDCIEFPASRLDLPAVKPIDFRMWCFRDATTRAGSDCQGTQRACELMANGLAARGVVKPQPWPDGALCAVQEKVVCYAQLDRKREQVKFICTPSFEECQARASEVRGPDFEVVGPCGVVTGNKPW
jgi:hypothetical protein